MLSEELYKRGIKLNVLHRAFVIASKHARRCEDDKEQTIRMIQLLEINPMQLEINSSDTHETVVSSNKEWIEAFNVVIKEIEGMKK